MIQRILKRIYTELDMIFRKVRFGKALSVKKGQNIKSDTKFILEQGGRISIDKVSTNSNVHFSCIGGILTIGKNVFFNRNCIVICRKEISIGDDCIFGPNIVIYDHDHVFGAKGIEGDMYKTDKVIIENGCWIGAGAVILKGAHIGEGSVIGAGSIVKGNIPAHSLVTMDRELNVRKIDDK